MYQTLCDIKRLGSGGSFDADKKWSPSDDSELVWRGYVDVQSMGFRETRDRFGDTSNARGVKVFFQDSDNPTRDMEITTDMVVSMDRYGEGSIVEVNDLSGFLAIKLG